MAIDFNNTTFTQEYSYEVRDDRMRLIRNLQAEIDRGKSDDAPALIAILNAIRSLPEQYVAYARSDKGKVSYATIPQHIYDVNKRVKTTFQRYVRRQCNISTDMLRDARLDDICSRLLPLSYSGIRIVDGQAIVEAYKTAVGFQSCMTLECSKYTEIYALNPDKVKMAIYGERDARALIFTCDDGTIVMDRVYPNNSRWSIVLRNWARKRRYVYRTNDGACDAPLSDNREHKLTLKCDNYFPYSDTFRYAKDIDEHTIICSNQCGFGDFQLTSQNGGTEGGRHRGDNRMRCYACGTTLNEDDAYTYRDDCYCETCFHEEFGYCEHCHEDFPNDEMHEVEGEWVCERCSEDAIQCYSCQDSFWSDNTVSTHDGEYSFCEACAESECSRCEDCGELFRNRDGVRTHDDDFYCDRCAEDNLDSCCECGDSYLTDDGGRVGDDFYCNNCMEENCSRCEDCGDMFKKDDGIRTKDDDEFYCTSCAESNNIVCCDECEEWVNHDSGHDCASDATFLCEECSMSKLSRCFHCGDYWLKNDIVITKDTATIYCTKCTKKLIADDKLAQCEVCNGYYTKEYEYGKQTQTQEEGKRGHECVKGIDSECVIASESH